MSKTDASPAPNAAPSGAKASMDTGSQDVTGTIPPSSVSVSALTGPTGAIVFPAMMGRYRLERELGRGAMGNVYLAHDTDLDRPVALKIPKFTAADNQELIARFLREARAAAVLAHPNICRVYDVNEHQGVRYIAMEFIEGKPLSAFIAGGNVQAKQAAAVIRKLALGLAEAHQRNILHRDLKPDNILVNKQGEPVLTDFGLARETTAGKASATQDGVILGSPAYMPPEQAAGNLSEMGPTSDIYSLGVVLYEMLTGEVPFRGSVVEVLASVLMKTPKTVREQKPDIDPGIAVICDKMMAKKAGDRYPTMMAVAQALGDWLRTGGQQQAAASSKLPEPLSNSGEFKIADPKSKLAAGPHIVEPKKIPGVNDKPKQTIAPGTAKQTISPTATKTPERTEKQINELAELGDQLLARNDYLEAIRLAEEIPDYQRTPALRRMLGESYELKGKVEKLERNLEKYLNTLDLPELKKTVTALLKIHPGHPRGKEIKKALNTGGKKAVVQILKDEGNYDAVGNVWEPKVLAGGIAGILALAVIAYFAVTIYIKGTMQEVAITIDDPTASVTIDGKDVLISGAGTGEIKLTLGSHEYTVTQGGTTVRNAQNFTVNKNGQNKLVITLKEQPTKPADSVGGTTVSGFIGTKAGDLKQLTTSNTRFRWCPSGTFLMGSPASEPGHQADEQGASGAPVSVTLTQGFWTQETAVTQAQWQALMGTAPWKGKESVKEGGNYPATYISRGESIASPGADTALAYCVKLTAQERSANRIPADWEFRLPTEAEREYACRAGTVTVFNFGDDFDALDQYGWFLTNTKDAGEAFVHEVGQKKPNPWGLMDMHGNVWEWCGDGYISPHPGGSDPQSSAEFGTVRGGSWDSTPAGCRSANRSQNAPTEATKEIGFRPVLAKVKTAALNNGTQPPLAVAPFDANQAKAHQEAWAKHLGVPVEYTNSLGMKFRLIPPGEYQMGAVPTEPESRGDESPRHKVTVTKPFYFGATEVTAKQWTDAMNSEPWKGQEFPPPGPDAAANYVNWNDATAYCEKLKSIDKTGGNYRLPTEAEWEMACRAGTETHYYFGNAESDFERHGWNYYNAIEKGEKYPHNVAQKLPNPYGLHDITGNLWEWCSDFYDEEYYKTSPSTDPTGPAQGSKRANRGGSWISNNLVCRTARRSGDDPVKPDGSYITGFRVAISIDAVKQALTTDRTGAAPPLAVAPFDTAQAKAHQESWAKHLGVPVEYTNSIGMKFRLIPPGEFAMGSTPETIDQVVQSVAENDPDLRTFIKSETPRHQVAVSQSFYLSATEVTAAQYAKMIGKGSVEDAAGSLPAVNVNWHDAAAFCKLISDSEKRSHAYRLPREAEWEYACRAGTATTYFCGDRDDQLADFAFFRDNTQLQIQPVAGKQPNAFGLFDMMGNAWEWCDDWWQASGYPVAGTDRPELDPVGAASGEWKIYRGGDSRSRPLRLRSASRHAREPGLPERGIGFRVVLPVDAVQKAIKG